MTPEEIDQFLCPARVGRIGISLEDGLYILYLWVMVTRTIRSFFIPVLVG